jgi:plastocyanin
MKRLSIAVFAVVIMIATNATATVWNVNVANFQFSPSQLTVLQGDTIIWSNTQGTHGIVSDCDPAAFGFAAASSPWTYQLIADIPVGSYAYHCPVHPTQMLGNLTIHPRGTWHVTVQNFSFTPANITITQGDTVVWNNIGGFHDVHDLGTPSRFGNAAANAPWTYSFIFGADTIPPGTYTYECTVHHFQGTVHLLLPAPLSAPANLAIYAQDSTSTHVQLWWGSVCGASGYEVLRSSDVSSDPFPVSLGVTSDTTITDSTASDRAFYLVRAVTP